MNDDHAAMEDAFALARVSALARVVQRSAAAAFFASVSIQLTGHTEHARGGGRVKSKIAEILFHQLDRKDRQISYHASHRRVARYV